MTTPHPKAEEARAAVPLGPVAYCWPIDLAETLPNDGWCVVHANDADMSDAVPLYSAPVLHRALSDDELNALWSEHAAPVRGSKTPPWIRFARGVLSAANRPKGTK